MLPGWLLEAVGNGGPRGMVIARRGVTRCGNRTRLMACFGQLFFTMTRTMSDCERWDRAVAAITDGYAAMSPALRAEVDAAAHAVRHARRELHSLAEDRQSTAICASCGGECCVRGKYHATVADVLVFLAEGEPVAVPRFESGFCPFLGDRGCVIEPSLRPFTCITFNCDLVERMWEPERVEEFYGRERELRKLYEVLQESFAISAGSALRVSVLGFWER